MGGLQRGSAVMVSCVETRLQDRHAHQPQLHKSSSVGAAASGRISESHHAAMLRAAHAPAATCAANTPSAHQTPAATPA